MAFNGKKCHVMHVTRNIHITSCSYTLGQDKLTQSKQNGVDLRVSECSTWFVVISRVEPHLRSAMWNIEESGTTIHGIWQHRVGPASTDRVRPASTDRVGPASTDRVRPASTDRVGPASTDRVRPASTDRVRPASTDRVRPASTDRVRPASTDRVGPASTDRVGPASTDRVRPASTDRVRPESTDPHQQTRINRPASTDPHQQTRINRPGQTRINRPGRTRINRPGRTRIKTLEAVQNKGPRYVNQDWDRQWDTRVWQPWRKTLVASRSRKDAWLTESYSNIRARTDAHKFSFLPRSIRAWNSLLPEMIAIQNPDTYRNAIATALRKGTIEMTNSTASSNNYQARTDIP